MKKLFVFALLLTFLTFSGPSPILTEKEAKQLLRSRRQDRPSKPGFPDEPMREYMHHLLRLEHRAEEQFLEHWLNPHCKPHCDRNLVHPVEPFDNMGLDNGETGGGSFLHLIFQLRKRMSDQTLRTVAMAKIAVGIDGKRTCCFTLLTCITH